MNKNSANALAEAVKQENPGDDAAVDPQNAKNSKTTKPRPDKGSTHAMRHGLLCQHIERAVARSGESLRNIRRYKKQFRAVFKPRGTLGELIFDRLWSDYLRLHLAAKLEAKMLTPDESRRSPATGPELREGDLPTLVTGSDLDEFEITQKCDSDLPQDLFRQLALVSRYDAHFARDVYRMAGLLLLMRKGGKVALEQLITDGVEFTKLQKIGR